MNADLLAMLGGAGPASASNSRRESEGKTILSFKAGKMNTSLQPNGKYLITPDPRRGTISLSWHTTTATPSSNSTNANNGHLKLEWTDRRTRTTVDSLTIFPLDNVTYTKIQTGRPKDRVFLLQYGTNTDNMYFYWMQDKEEGNEDDDNCVKVNMYAADPNEAKTAANGGVPTGDSSTDAAGGEGEEDGAASSASASTARRSGALDMSGLGGGGLDNAALMQILGGLNNRPASDSDRAATTTPNASDAVASTTGGAATGAQGQVDALSNILENLGMPQPSGSSTAPAPMVPATPTPTTTTSAAPATPTNAPTNTTTPSAPALTTTTTTTATTKGLTLSDLQGAMATLATTSPPASTDATQPGPPLETIITPETIISSGLLDDPDVKARLIQFLPEDQRSEEWLMENLRSPQVMQCLKSLTGAICDDGDGGALGSLLANFQLSPEDGAEAMNRGNPIQAFLDCVLKSVEREKEAKGGGGGKEENNDGDAEMSG